MKKEVVVVLVSLVLLLGASCETGQEGLDEELKEDAEKLAACGDLSGQERIDCDDNYYYSKVKETGELEFCERISRKDVRGFCLGL
tara:strand:+ start:191 stop:448 length:258 start_codon:yes stop_codon:yes gene_type:complete